MARAFESDAGAAATVWNPGPELVALEVSWPGRTLRTVDTLTGATATLAAGEVAVMRFA